jgi:hypothetical protein
MAETPSKTDARTRARELVARVRERVARQTGTPATEGAESAAGQTPGDQASLSRAPGYAKSRTQRSQGRREGK